MKKRRKGIKLERKAITGIVLMVIGAVVLIMSPLSAAWAFTYWQVTTGNWSTDGNWTAGEPTADDGAYINNGGTAQITQGGEICYLLYLGEASGENGTVELIAGDLSTNIAMWEWEYVGYEGTGAFIHTGGTNDTYGLLIALGSASTGTYELSDGASLSSTDDQIVGCGGTGMFTQTGGTNTVGSDLWVGLEPGSSGTYELSGGTLSLPRILSWESVGLHGTGTFIHTGGTNGTPGGLVVGENEGGVGTYELSGSGSLSADNAIVGRDSTSSGTFTQTGGTNTIGEALYLGYFPGSSGTYTISNGELTIGSLLVGVDGHGTLDITGAGAEITVSNLLSFGANSAFAAVAGACIHMTGANFENLSTNEAELAGLANLELIFEGGSADTDDVEVACEDKGAVAAGFVDNFALGKLTLGGVDIGMVRLVDNTDNGNRDGTGGNAEALYVDRLELGAGSVLDLNNLHLYWRSGFVDNGGTILNGEVIQVQEWTIYVDDDAPNDPGPGDPTVSDPDEDGSPEHPFDAIQEGIDAANNGDEVLVLDGTYTGPGNKNLDFNGKAITVRSENGPDNCIIDCEGNGRGFSFHTGETDTSVVDGFTIINGYSNTGGGVYCDSDPIIMNCTITGNSANFGAGIRCAHTDGATIINCTITGNSAYNDGGAVYSYNSSPTITNCTISDNWAEYYGGGVHCEEQSGASITNCTITGNSARCGGGVQCRDNSSPTITNCTISDNSASVNGGGIYSNTTTTTLSNCILWGDQPQEIYIYSGNVVAATYCDIQGGWPGEGNIDADPLFVCHPDTCDTADFHLRWGSPCIDAGDTNTIGLPEFDFEGEPRIMDGDSNGVAIVDMGADEFPGYQALDHDVAITDVTPSDSVVTQGDSTSINVTVENQGDYTETFNVTTHYSRIIPNGDFEKDTTGTEKDDISEWNYDIVVHQGNPPTGDNLQIVDDYYFKGDKSVYSYLQTTSVSPSPGDSRVSQYLSTEEPVSTTADYISLWIGGDGYTTSSRYAWHIALILTDGNDTYEEILQCHCWGNNEGCTPNDYDYYDATETGADGNTWKRYTREIPDNLDKSNLTVKVKHYQHSWDLTQASSWYRLDNIYFSDSEGNPRTDIETKIVSNLSPEKDTTLTFAWNTTGVALGDYVISAYAHPIPGETDTADNTYIDDVVIVVETYTENRGKASIPAAFTLAQNYPNPFNPITEIEYTLPKDCYVKLEVYNILGQRVARLVDGQQKAGYKSIRWDAGSFSSGIYFCRLKAGNFVQTKKMVLIR